GLFSIFSPFFFLHPGTKITMDRTSNPTSMIFLFIRPSPWNPLFRRFAYIYDVKPEFTAIVNQEKKS
ncbi:MAG: hypothetical protein JW833_07255, partial [Prolixibacteraceae bacterium]|nr:hypothetical protein [Prolixibacteraceae bacterium]